MRGNHCEPVARSFSRLKAGPAVCLRAVADKRAVQRLLGGRSCALRVLPLRASLRLATHDAGVLEAGAIGAGFERTQLGAQLRAATEKTVLTQSFGINVPLLLTLTYGAGIGLAAFAGVLAAPILHVNPAMGSNLVIVVFAIVVIGGMGSMLGSIVTALVIGVVEGWTRVFYSEASSTVIFVLMALVLLLRPKGLFGREGSA